MIFCQPYFINLPAELANFDKRIYRMKCPQNSGSEIAKTKNSNAHYILNIAWKQTMFTLVKTIHVYA